MAHKLVGPDGTPVKYQGQEIFSCDYSGVVKGVDMEKRRLIMVGTDETRDRDGDIIRLSGWKLDNYRKNPVFLWAHNYGSVPIGRAEKVTKRKDPPRMEFQLVFPTKGIYPFADMILELYEGKFINTSSVGFIPAKWEPIPEDEKGEGPDNPYGRVYVNQELLELSGCAVPSNPNALQNALKGKNFGFKQDDLVKYLSGTTLIPRPDKEDDVLEELDKSESDIVDETVIQVQVPDNLNDSSTNSAAFNKDVSFSITESETVSTGMAEITTGSVIIPQKEFDDLIPKEDVEILEVEKIEDDVALKPFPNEHACRIANPADFDKFARKNCFRKVDEKCVDYIFGIKDNKSHLQALRFDKEVWTEAAAKGVCERVGGSFEAAKPPKQAELDPSIDPGLELHVLDPDEDMEEVKTRLDKVEIALNTINQTLQSMVESVKGFQTSLTKVTEESQRKPDTGVDPASAILRDGFRQSKTKPEPTPKPSGGTSVGGGYSPESVRELTQVLIDFSKALKSIKL